MEPLPEIEPKPADVEETDDDAAVSAKPKYLQ
jgi:hypothetical protein